MWHLPQARRGLKLVKRLCRELNNIDDHKLRKILADFAQIGKVLPKVNVGFRVWQF